MRATLIRSAALVILCSMLAVAASGATVRRAASAGDVQGDVDCGATVNSVDALQILRSAAGLPGDAACLQNAGDTNCDTAINAVDSLRILRFLAGLPNRTPDGCAAIGDALGPPPSSFDLIDKALADGDIDSQTAVVYGVYATFLDPRLPGQYHGQDSGGPADSDALLEAASQFDSLSPANQAAVAPFLIPPVYEGSWLNPQGAGSQAGLVLPAVCADATPDWGCVDGTAADVRVWWQTRYPDDEAQAQSIAAAMDSTIWPSLTSLMGTPLSDAGQQYDGGSGAVDIFLVDAARSVAPDHQAPGCKKTPAYINLQRGASLDVAAHEFMHVLQWTFDVSTGCVYQPGGEYNWLMEATATWAQDYVYPDGNGEHYIADWYMEKPGLPLDTTDDRHEYGAYLFFLQLTRFYGTGQIVRTVWNNTEQYGSLEAVDRSIPDGLDGRFPVFTSCLWNRPPVDCYAQADQLAQGVEAFVGALKVELGGQTKVSFPLGAEVEHMAASYSRFEFKDDQVRSVTFQNTLHGVPHAAVQALAKINGQWQGPLGWTGNATTSFCRDMAAQHIEEVIVIISNSDWETKAKLNPAEASALTASTAGCTDWVGTARANLYDGNIPSITYKIEVTDLRFSYYETEGNEARYAVVASSDATWKAEGTNGPCTVSGEMPLIPADPFSQVQGEIDGRLRINLDDNTYRLEITGFDPTALVTTSCPDGYRRDDTWPYVYITQDGGFPHEPTADGGIVDSYTTDQLLASGTWEWHLEPGPPE